MNLPVKPNKGGIPAIDSKHSIVVYVKNLKELSSLT
jgi:hypothetical protein